MADISDNLKSEGDTVQVPPLNIDTPQSDAAIADIVAQESDELLAAQDARTTIEAEAITDESEEPRGHPIFWFIVAFVAIVCLFATYLLLIPS